MNKPELVKIEGPFEAGALRILREIPGVTAVAEPWVGDRKPDFLLHFGDAQAPIAVEVKRQASAATAWQLAHYAAELPGMRMLLIAERTTAEARKILEDHGIAVIDGLGNAHLDLPGLLFHIEGPHGRPARLVENTPPTRLQGKAGVAAEALLLDVGRAWRVNDLADKAKVSTGLAHRVLARLEGDGVLQVEGDGPRRVRRVKNPTALLDLWAEENVEKPVRTQAYLLAQTPRKLIEQIGLNLERAGIDHALTGAAAAALVAPFVTAVPVVEVWVDARTAPDKILDAVHAEPVVDGQNVVFLQTKDDAPLAFREKVQDLWVTNRFRMYDDLLRDPRRGREQADHLRREVIHF